MGLQAFFQSAERHLFRVYVTLVQHCRREVRTGLSQVAEKDLGKGLDFRRGRARVEGTLDGEEVGRGFEFFDEGLEWFQRQLPAAEIGSAPQGFVVADSLQP